MPLETQELPAPRHWASFPSFTEILQPVVLLVNTLIWLSLGHWTVLSLASDTSPKHLVGRLAPMDSRSGERHLSPASQEGNMSSEGVCACVCLHIESLVSFLFTSSWTD